jgi:hypothetical protein
MSEYYSFIGVEFVAVVPSSGETPFWVPKLETTDRPLIGTDRFERSIRSSTWLLDLDLWIEPSASAGADFHTLQSAYANGIVGQLQPVGESHEPIEVVLTAFDVAPQRGGIDGYRGKATFGSTAGVP